MKLSTNTVVIGAGVAGMTCALYLKRFNIDVILLEKSAPGGQINRTSRIDNYPGMPEVAGVTLSMNLFEQVNTAGVEYRYGNVLDIIDHGEYKIIKTDQEELTAQNVVIASGRKPRELGLENEKQLTGRGISWCATCDGPLYKDKKVAVVGGGNTALEEALYLSELCSEVYLIHRREAFRADSILQEKVKQTGKIKVLSNCVISTLNMKEDKLSSILVEQNGEQKELELAGLFISIGHIPDLDFVKTLELKLEDGYIVTDGLMHTNIPHLYACGDILKKELYQITTAVGEGATAAMSVKKDLI